MPNCVTMATFPTEMAATADFPIQYVHGHRPTQKSWGRGPWTKYKQNANLGNSYCSDENLHQAHTVVSQYLNTYRRTFTANTDWNVTNLFSKIGGTFSSVIDAHEYIQNRLINRSSNSKFNSHSAASEINENNCLPSTEQF